MLRTSFTLAAALCCGAAANADHYDEAANVADSAKLPNRAVANWLIVDNELEIKVSEFARERAQTADVKEFAGRMVSAHRDLVRKLRQAGRRAAAHGTLPADERREIEEDLRDDIEERREDAEDARENRAERRREAAEEVDEAREELREARVDSVGDALQEAGQDVEEAAEAAGRGARRAGREVAEETRDAARDVRRETGELMNRGDNRRMRQAGVPRTPAVNLHAAIAEKMGESVTEMLGNQTGKQFDMGYMSQQIMAHAAMLDTLAVLRGHASPELVTVIEQAETATRNHLDEAKELAMRVDRRED